jgi:hypothetical protein
MSDFWEQYKHPQWQKMRLEIMHRDEFACVECGDKDSTLNVHHTYYERGFKPWEYPRESLRTLCETCHKNATEQMKEIRRYLGELMYEEIDVVLGYVQGMLAMRGTLERVHVGSMETAWGIEDYCKYIRGVELLSGLVGKDDYVAGATLVKLRDERRNEWMEHQKAMREGAIT